MVAWQQGSMAWEFECGIVRAFLVLERRNRRPFVPSGWSMFGYIGVKGVGGLLEPQRRSRAEAKSQTV